MLAHKLTYVCRSDRVVRAVTMDYGEAHGSMSDPTPMSLKVVGLSAEETRETLEAVFGQGHNVLQTLLDERAPQTWTVAVLSDLKARGPGIQLGRLRWILRTALPLGDQFKLWFNAEELESTKIDASPPWEFVVGETDATLDGWPYKDAIVAQTDGPPAVQLEHAGRLRGTAQLYGSSLKGGRFDERARSHGFFVKVRDRLVNLDDETFGIDVELSHGVLTRFRMEVYADGLDQHLSSPRESIQESPALDEVRDYLLSVFNRARVWRAKQEEQTDSDLLAASERISLPPPALSTGPLRRVLRRALDGDSEIAQSLRIDPGELQQAADALEAGDTLLQQVFIEPLGHEKPLVSTTSPAAPPSSMQITRSSETTSMSTARRNRCDWLASRNSSRRSTCSTRM